MFCVYLFVELNLLWNSGGLHSVSAFSGVLSRSVKLVGFLVRELDWNIIEYLKRIIVPHVRICSLGSYRWGITLKNPGIKRGDNQSSDGQTLKNMVLFNFFFPPYTQPIWFVKLPDLWDLTCSWMTETWHTVLPRLCCHKLAEFVMKVIT